MADTQPYRPRKRGYETLKDMMWSLVPIVVLVVAAVYFCGPRDTRSEDYDPQSDITGAAQVVGYPLVAPAPSSKKWHPQASAMLKDSDGQINGLSIGYRTDGGKVARFVIQAGSRSAVLKTALGKASVVADPDGKPVELADLEWTPVSITSGRALVAEGDGYSAVVTGDTSYSELRELAGSVRPAQA